MIKVEKNGSNEQKNSSNEQKNSSNEQKNSLNEQKKFCTWSNYMLHTDIIDHI